MSKSGLIRLGINIDHVATLRQARFTVYPDPLEAALIAEKSGADYITLHLREDRRHIQDDDVERIKNSISSYMNLELAITGEMLSIAEKIKPRDCCLVPEKREELTTEGGLDAISQRTQVLEACERMAHAGVLASLFIDADHEQINAAKECGAKIIEIHTGHYANAGDHDSQSRELEKIAEAAKYADSIGLQVNAGHGLNYDNVQPIAAIEEIRDLNIGHAVIARSVFIGMEKAVSEMKDLMVKAR